MDESEVPLQPPAPVIGVVYNLKKGIASEAPDAEAEYDNMETVDAICAALENGGCRVLKLEADATLPEKLRETMPDMVFNIAEGFRGRGREAQIPAVLNMLGIPFTGSDETTLCIALDKALTKRMLSTYHIRTPRYAVFDNNAAPHLRGLRFPLIVKPNAEGSSKGISEISIVETPDELRALLRRNAALYGQSMLAEEYIPGREFTVGLLGNGSDLRVFPPMEVIFRRNTQKHYRVYSYNVKQDYKSYVEYKCPPDLDPALVKEMTDTAARIFRILSCKDFGRIDFRLGEDGKIYFIEINPLPGLAPGYSDYPMLAEFSGVGYDELVLGILLTSMRRHGMPLWLEPALITPREPARAAIPWMALSGAEYAVRP